MQTHAPKIAKILGGLKPSAVMNFLWGKFYWVTKEKKFTKKAPSENAKTLFVKFVMQPLVDEYRRLFTDEIAG